jgi:hypothetical protein
VKTGIAVLISVGLLTFAGGQESRQTSEAVARPIGLEIGEQAPAFAVMDQFGHEQSIKTLRGPKGTVLLFTVFTTSLLENSQLRAIDYRLKPGEKEPMHSHPCGVFVVLLQRSKDKNNFSGRQDCGSVKQGR